MGREALQIRQIGEIGDLSTPGFPAVPFVDQVSLPRPDEALSSTEKALKILVNEARTKSAVVIEGPPIYVWPAIPELQWRNQAFIAGMNFENRLDERLQKNKTRRYALIDDLNYRPKRADDSDFRRQLVAMEGSSDAIRQSPVFSGSERVVRFLESDLADQVGSTQCSVLDAVFNKAKITDNLYGYGKGGLVYPEWAHKLMLIVISPKTAPLRAEQLNMVQALYEMLVADPYYRSKRDFRTLVRNIIAQTYRHVWINGQGEVEEMTQIEFSNNRFNYKDLSIVRVCKIKIEYEQNVFSNKDSK